MGHLISIIGNTGAGKTTLARALCATGRFVPGFEQHAGRPFQAIFASNLQRYALANQVDYMLLRAEQEEAIRRGADAGVIDGGLEQDFFIYTRLFNRRGYLSDAEYQLCERLYRGLRRRLPTPDLFIYLSAPQGVLTERFAARERAVEIARADDIPLIEELLQAWLEKEAPSSMLTVDSGEDVDLFATRLPAIMSAVERRLEPVHAPRRGE